MGGTQTGDRAFSVELCGGTHVRRTGDIGLLKVVSEGAVSSGVRRIEALSGAAAVDYLEAQEAALQAAAAALKSAPADVPVRVRQLVDERKKMEREISELRKKVASGGNSSEGPSSKTINGVTFVGKMLEGISGKELKGLVDDIKGQIKSGVVAVVAVSDGKASLVVGVSDDLTSGINAVDLVRVGAGAVGGKGGGGRADMAQAGGPDGAQAPAALAAIEAALGS